MSLWASTLSSATHYRMGWYWPDKRLGGSFLKMKRTKPDGTISTICTYVSEMCQQLISLHGDNKLQWRQKPLHILFSLQSTIFKESESNQGSNSHFHPDGNQLDQTHILTDVCTTDMVENIYRVVDSIQNRMVEYIQINSLVKHREGHLSWPLGG
jgi:hypothetical protein